MYSIYDKKAGFYGQPFPAKTEPEALRMVSDVLTFGDSLIAKHPSDFDLYYVGQFDDLLGIYVPQTPSLLVITVNSLALSIE